MVDLYRSTYNYVLSLTVSITKAGDKGEKMKYRENLSLFTKTLVFNFGIVYLTLNIFSLFIELTKEPMGGFLGQCIFVFMLTLFNFIFQYSKTE